MKKLFSLLTLLLLLCTSAWADTTLFSLSVDEVSDYNLARQGGSLSLTTSNYLTALTGGTASLENYSTSTGSDKVLGSDKANSVTEKHIRLASNNIALKLVLSSALAKGDVISFTNNGSVQISFTTSTTRATSPATTLGSYTIPDKSALIGESTIYIWRASGSNAFVKTLTITRPATAPGEITFSPSAGSVETGSSISLSSSNSTSIEYKWASSVIGDGGDWAGAITYSNETKPVVPAVGSENNILSVKATNDNGSTYGSATYTITAAKTATTTAITSASKSALNTDIKNGTSAGTLAATVTPSGESALASPAITWLSSVTTVATINESTGAITLVGEGTTTITASYAGDATYAGSSDTYDLTVTDTRKSVTLAFSATSITDFNYDNETLTAPSLSAVDEDENPVDLEDLPELTFSTPSGGVVTVNATTGALTAANVNNFGSSTITAAFPGNSTYKPATSKTYTVTRSPMLRQVIFDNGFEAFIAEGSKTVEVYYMAGSSAPSQTGDIKKADGYTATVVGNTVVLTKDTHTKTYNIVSTAVTPFEGSGKQTFDGTETYVKSGYGWDNTKKWKFSKTDDDWTREAPGKSRLYFFVGAAASASLSFSTSRDITIKVNGVDAGTSAGSISLNADQFNMIEIQSNQTSGDGGFKDLTLTSPKKSAKITSAGWATFSYASPLDLTDANRPAGLTAYQVEATGINSEAHTIAPTAINSTVAANTGLLLKGTAGVYYIPIVAEGTSLSSTNKLVAVTADNTSINDEDLFVLAYQGGEVVFAHTGEHEATLNKGQAYLNLDGVSHAPGMRIVLGENNATNIENVGASEEGVKFIQNGKLFIKKNGVVYDMLGTIVRK